jgi:Tol biopolymer transport system component
VAFIRSHIPGIEDVYVLPIEGGEPRRITFDNRDITGVGWSPDGSSLVFSSNRAGTYSMWKSRLVGGEPEWIAGGGMKLKHPAVARQKDVVAYENWVYEINIWQVPAKDPSNADSVVSSTQWDMQPQFSPEGNRIAFISTRSGNAEIWTAGADGANPIQLTSLGGPHTSQPRWSPDGEHLVFVSRPEGQADLYTVAVSGTPPRRLTSHELDEMAPSWSADGRWIYFGSRRSGRWEIWKVPFEGGGAQQVTTNGGYAARESVDGASLYFVKSFEAGLWKASSPDCREETLVVEGFSPGAWGSWVLSADGVFFVRNTDTGPEIVFHELGSGTTASIASVPEFMGPGLTLSPDGERILFAQIDRHECDVMVAEGLLLNGYRAR